MPAIDETIIALEWLERRGLRIFRETSHNDVKWTLRRTRELAQAMDLHCLRGDAWVSLDKISGFGMHIGMVFPSAIGFHVSMEALNELKAIVLKRGWLEFQDGVLLNPKKIALLENGIIYNDWAGYLPERLTPEGKARFDALPWLNMPSGISVNLAGDISSVKPEFLDIPLIEKARVEVAGKTGCNLPS